MCFRLRNWIIENLLEFLTLEWMYTIIIDEVIETVKEFWFNKAIFSLSMILLGLDTTMVYNSTVSTKQKKLLV